MAQTKTTTKNNTQLKPATVKKKSNSKAPAQKLAKTENNTTRIIWGIVFLILGALIFISYFYNEGALIVYFSDVVKGILGYGYWAVGPCFLLIFIILCFGEKKRTGLRIFMALLFPLFFSGVLHLISFGGDTTLDIAKYFNSGKQVLSGGVLGSLLGYVTFKLLSKVGGAIILFIILIIQLFIILGANADTFKFSFSDKYESEPSYEQASTNVKSAKNSQKNQSKAVPFDAAKDNPYLDNIDKVQRKNSKDSQKSSTKAKTGSDFNMPLGEDFDSKSKSSTSTKMKGTKIIPVTIEEPEVNAAEIAAPSRKSKPRMKAEELEKETKQVEKEITNSEAPSGNYVYPLPSLLKYGKNNGSDSKGQVLETKARLENTLHSFGINSEVKEMTIGPTVTRYDIELEQGVKLAKVTNLAGDIALSLGVLNVRVAPIPDKISTVGIEVPNKIVNTVSLREIIESDNFIKAKSKLTFAIGKDIGGNCIVGNISKLPHMLIAGTTGSGKSVCMNSLILSLLYKAGPEEVRFIMIDPKMVELGIYNTLPHLYVPVVTEPKKAAGALQWAVVEMLKRYRLFSEASVRDLETYNNYCENNSEAKLPQVVIVIDELADLMMAASKEVEESICRIAQMGRAAGMHLIIATQRPSADVITGLMKANIPSRIAFAVSSAMESRIIMDSSGAEKLVGMGDMLYSPLGSGKPLRVQGSFVSDQEREEVIKFIVKNNSDISIEKNSELLNALDNISDTEENSKNDDKDSSSIAGDYDEVLPKAVEVVLEMKSCSVSMLQRRLKLGYSRAARVVDQMEELGIVGPYEGAKPRSVIVDREGWNEIQIELGLASEDDFQLAAQMSDNYDDGFSEY